jgi:hypothetical protein
VPKRSGPRCPQAYAAGLGLLLAITACSDPEPISTAPPSEDPTQASGGPTESPTGPGSAVEAAVLKILDWRDTAGGGDVPTVENTAWTLTADSARSASLVGLEQRLLDFPRGVRISELLLDNKYAVVVVQDPTETEPGSARVVRLNSGATTRIDASSEVPTVNGGTWTLGEGKVFHATYGPKRAYCLAEVDLASNSSRIAWCAPRNQGFNDARITPTGLTVLSFTLGQDGCRTPVSVTDGAASPLAGVTECIGWDSLLTPTGQVWSETPDANRIEEASFFARTGERTVELGTGDTGSLTWCGGAAYFTQQPQRDGDPARLLRWTADSTLEIVYETPGSPGFLSEPRCGGSRITVTAKSEGGDEQVSAPSN